jgi:hypothetical protein
VLRLRDKSFLINRLGLSFCPYFKKGGQKTSGLRTLNAMASSQCSRHIACWLAPNGDKRPGLMGGLRHLTIRLRRRGGLLFGK